MPDTYTFSTIGEISRQLSIPIHRVQYVIRSRGIQSIGKAGNAHIYSQSTVQQIRCELQQIDADREGCTDA